MARKRIVQYTDDLTGKPLDEQHLVNVKIAYKGKNYTLHTTKEGTKQLDSEMSQWLNAATLESSPPVRRERRDPAQTKEIRRWANAHGYEIGPRGAIPRDIVKAYEQSVGKR